MHGTNPKIGTFGSVLCGALVPRVGGVLGEQWVWFVVGETFGETFQVPKLNGIPYGDV